MSSTWPSRHRRPQPTGPPTTEQRVLDAALKLAPDEGWTCAHGRRRPARPAGSPPGETELLLPARARATSPPCCRAATTRAALAALADVDPDDAEDPRAHRPRRRGPAGRRRRPTRPPCAAGPASWPCRPTCRSARGWPGRAPTCLWRWAGDTATDENHYSKRALLAGILTGALAIRLSVGPRAPRWPSPTAASTTSWPSRSGRPGSSRRPVRDVAAALGRMRYG